MRCSTGCSTSQAQRLQSYATQRWVIPPTQLFDGRLREAMAARGALTWFGDTAVPALKVDMLEFEQVLRQRHRQRAAWCACAPPCTTMA
ncbi:hypothetical protein ACTMU2_07215 [Cupriavidus basilensis]